MRKLTATLFFILPLLLSAQSYPWEFGGGVYITAYQGDLHASEVNFGQYSPSAAGALHVRRNVSNSVVVRLNALFGQLAGDDNNFDEPEWRQTRGISFTSPLLEFTALGELYPFGMFRQQEDGKRRIAAPYLMFGVGTVYTNPTVDWNDENGNSEIDPADAQYDKSQKLNKFNITIPFGAGLRFALNKKMTLGLEGAMRPTFSDYIDGVSQVGNPDETDWYFAGGITFSYAFGKQPQPVAAVAKPAKADRDLDGVADANDFCPDIAGLANLNGCPDADGDGVIDLRDKCPDLAGSLALDGCPDADNDGVTDKDDKCPTTPGDPTLNGCPDTDRDGIADQDDACPTEKGVTTAKGCPDKDNDGVPDKDDACPEFKGLPAFKGCLDTDGDGIYDNEDRCPDIAGVRAAKGCPEIKTEDKEKLKSAVKLVQFKTGEAKLLSQSYAVLDEVAELMRKYPAYHLSIGGHTDNSGNDKLNQSLSEQRANTCYLYLIRKDVSPSRMTHAGFGESNPVADNGTSAGRAQNRRVEFDLYVQ